MAVTRDDFNGSITTLWNTSAGDTWDTLGGQARSNIQTDYISFITGKTTMLREVGAYIKHLALQHATATEATTGYFGPGDCGTPGTGYLWQISYGVTNDTFYLYRTDTWATLGTYVFSGHVATPIEVSLTFEAGNNLVLRVNGTTRITVTNNTLVTGTQNVGYRGFNTPNTASMIAWYEWCEYGIASAGGPKVWMMEGT